MRAAASSLIVIAVVAVVAYVALRGPDYAHVRYVPHASPATAVVSGRAVDETGRPVADVALTWFSVEATQGGLFGGTVFRGDETGVRSAADGTFRLAGLRGREGHVGPRSGVAVPVRCEGPAARRGQSAQNASGYVIRSHDACRYLVSPLRLE